MKQTTLPY